jgi:YfiH family protein
MTQQDTNRMALIAELQIAANSLITARQVHGIRVLVVDAATLAANASGGPWQEQEADAIVTTLPDVAIAVKVADCCGIVLHDQALGAIGVVHSGWRGTAQGVLTAAITTMQAQFGTEPSDLRAWMSACASVANYQVGADVHSVLGRFCVRDPTTSGRWFFDNHAALRAELLSCDVQDESILLDPACTITDTRYHSYRRDREVAGRGLVFAKLLAHDLNPGP